MDTITPELLRLEAVVKLVSISKATIYRRMKEGVFPLPVKIGRTQRWKRADINSWIEGLEYGLVEGFSGTLKQKEWNNE